MEQDIIDLFEKSGPFNHIVYTAGERKLSPARVSLVQWTDCLLENSRTSIAEANIELIKNAGTIRYMAPIFLSGTYTNRLQRRY